MMPTSRLDQLPQGTTDSVQHLYGGDFVPRTGGVLILDGDVVLGAAGASGAQSDQDEEAVQSAVQRGQTEHPRTG